jgi:hypothetical protein
VEFFPCEVAARKKKRRESGKSEINCPRLLGTTLLLLYLRRGHVLVAYDSSTYDKTCLGSMLSSTVVIEKQYRSPHPHIDR